MLFQRRKSGDPLHSGKVSKFKIECDVFDREDIRTLALLAARLVGPFEVVEGVPSGGLLLADELEQNFATPASMKGKLLIVDDVLTTGSSMEEHRAGRDALGLVVFARGPCPKWVKPIFRLNPKLNGL